MAGHLHDVLLSVGNPDFVVEGGNEEQLVALYKRSDKLLVVVYKEGPEDGFVITAFFTSKIGQLLKRKIIWQK